VGFFVGVVALAVAVCIVMGRPLRGGRAMRVVLGAAVAPPVGLMLLGFVFDNTPIELRYLSFGLPFVALLMAWALPRGVLSVVLVVQFASVAGLLLSPRTMQPARAVAAEAVRLVGDGVVLVPRGNDGVGIVGAFGIEAPPALPMLVIGPADPVAERIGAYRRVAVAVMAQDRDSVATIGVLRAVLAASNWRLVASGSSVEVYERE
jgi:hypothetical protein